MKRFWVTVIAVVVIFGSTLLSLSVYDLYRERTLRTNLSKIRIGMAEQEVIQILGEPTDCALSDIPGTYWCYDPSTFGRLIDDNPSRMGHLVLEMGANGKVVKVFDLK